MVNEAYHIAATPIFPFGDFAEKWSGKGAGSSHFRLFQPAQSRDWRAFHSCRASWKPSRIAVFLPQVLHSNQKTEEPPPTWMLAAGGAQQKEHTLIGLPGRRDSGHSVDKCTRLPALGNIWHNIIDCVEE
jgi:hypothetical protein